METLGRRFAVRFQERQPEKTLEWLDEVGASLIADQAVYLPAGLLKGWLHDNNGDRKSARDAYESALVLLDAELNKRPDDGRVLASIGLAQAGLDHREEALQAGQRACNLMPITKDTMVGAGRVYAYAKIQARVRETDASLDNLEHLLSIPCVVSGNSLKLDPHWDVIRDHPRLRALVEQPDKVF